MPQDEPQDPEAPDGSGGSGGAPVALIVDDDDDIRRFLGITLQLEGFSPHAVPSGPDALDWMAGNRPDLIVLDQMMPEMTGLEVAAKIRKDGYEGPAILFSAFMDANMARRCKRLDLEPLSKVDIAALKRVIRVMAADLRSN